MRRLARTSSVPLKRFRATPRGVDRPVGQPGTARTRPAPGEARPAALQPQVPGACGPGRRRGAGRQDRPVRASKAVRSWSWCGLAPAMRVRVDSCLRLIADTDVEIDTFGQLAGNRLRHDPGYAAVQTIPGMGPTLGAVFVAEIGDVRRFRGPTQLTSWAGLTPRHRESATTVHGGRITKQGSRLIRWAAIEAVQRGGTGTRIGAYRER